MIGEQHLTDLALSATDWQTIQSMCDVLEIFDEVTEEISAEKTVTVSKLLVLINGINKHLRESIIDSSNNDLMDLLATLKVKFSSRSMKYSTNNIVTSATFLDPRFKRHGFPGLDDVFQQTEREITNIAGNNI